MVWNASAKLRAATGGLILLCSFGHPGVLAHDGESHQISESGPVDTVASAIHWLALLQRNDGAVITDLDIATSWQTTAEALSLFVAFDTDQVDIPKALTLVDQSLDTLPTEYLARLLVVQSLSLADTTSLRTELLQRQNRDGGFGELAGYQSTPLDTAYALIALQANQSDALPARTALGYFSNQQKDDGGFSIGANASSPVITAMVVKALNKYLFSFNISTMLGRSVDYLYAEQSSNNRWGAQWETALVLQALIPVTTDTTRYQAALDQLVALQNPDGDWLGEAYTTALSAQVLQLAENIETPSDPEKAIVSGRILDGQSGEILPNAVVDILTIDNENIELRENGSFVISGLDAGGYIVSYSAPGYVSASQNLTLQKGQFANVGDIQLELAPSSALIQGTITRSDTGAPVVGAIVGVSVNGVMSTATTNIEGSYQLLTEAGDIALSVSADGYHPVSAQASIEVGNKVQFSPALSELSNEQPTRSGLIGRIIDAEGTPLADVEVTAGETTVLMTDAEGRFIFEDLDASDLRVNVSKAGFSSIFFDVTLPERTNINVGDITLRERVELPSSTVEGRVIDLVTGLPVPAASISAGGNTTLTDSNGFYRITDISVLEFTIAVNAEGYLFTNKLVSLPEHASNVFDINIRQAELGGIDISDIVIDQAQYGAYEAVRISVGLENNTALEQGARLYVVVRNDQGERVSEFSGAYLKPLDPQSSPEEIAHYEAHLQETIETVAAGQQRVVELEQWWNTLAYPPGRYTLTVQALDAINSRIVAESAVLIDVIPTQKIALNISATPGYVLLNREAEINLTASIRNQSNVDVTASLDVSLSSPSGQRLFEEPVTFSLSPDQINETQSLSTFTQVFESGGYYTVNTSNIDGALVSESNLGSIFVPPSIRVRATQSLDKYEVVPIEGIDIESRIEIEGVDGE